MVEVDESAAVSQKALDAKVREGIVDDACGGKCRIAHMGAIGRPDGAEKEFIRDDVLIIGEDGLAPYQTGLGFHWKSSGPAVNVLIVYNTIPLHVHCAQHYLFGNSLKKQGTRYSVTSNPAAYSKRGRICIPRAVHGCPVSVTNLSHGNIMVVEGSDDHDHGHASIGVSADCLLAGGDIRHFPERERKAAVAR
jgi:hypothetical protein